jgi:hypothetical protein
MFRAYDLTGLRKGKLVALARVENDPYGKAQWVCQCDCGGAHIVRSDNFRNGKVTKCEACARPAREELHIDAWYHLVLLGSDVTGVPGFVDGLAGFCVVTLGGREVCAPEWVEGRRSRSAPMPVVNHAVRALAKLGVIKCPPSVQAASAWVRRNADKITHHSFNEGDRVWTEWFARTGEWRGPVDTIESIDLTAK